MSAPPLPAATADPVSDAAPQARSTWLIIGGVLVVAWIGFLAALTIWTANPPVVNQLQIASSDLIFVGKWKNRAAGEFTVERELKDQQVQGLVVIEDLPPSGPPTAGVWVIPVTRLGKHYSVTHGALLNRPAQPAPEQQPWRVDVPAQYYPATDDVLQQIDSVLKRQR